MQFRMLPVLASFVIAIPAYAMEEGMVGNGGKRKAYSVTQESAKKAKKEETSPAEQEHANVVPSLKQLCIDATVGSSKKLGTFDELIRKGEVDEILKFLEPIPDDFRLPMLKKIVAQMVLVQLGTGKDSASSLLAKCIHKLPEEKRAEFLQYHASQCEKRIHDFIDAANAINNFDDFKRFVWQIGGNPEFYEPSNGFDSYEDDWNENCDVSRLHDLLAQLKGGDLRERLIEWLDAKQYVCSHEYCFCCGNALYHAVIKGDEKLVRYLIDSGLVDNITSLTWGGMSLLHHAAQYGYTDIMFILFDAGRFDDDVDIPDTYGDTPLHIAIKNRQFDSIQFLVERGADIAAENEEGVTPLALARNDKEIFKFIEKLVDQLSD